MSASHLLQLDSLSVVVADCTTLLHLRLYAASVGFTATRFTSPATVACTAVSTPRYPTHLNWSPISLEAERQRVIQCLQTATERRSFQGLRLELHVRDRKKLLADVTRTFRENGLLVRKAEVSPEGRMSINNFYAANAFDQQIDFKTIDNAWQRIWAATSLQVKDEPCASGRYMMVHENSSDTANKGTLRIGLLYLMKNLWC